MKGREPKDIDEAIEKLATRNVYHSHGSVIDYKEAQELGFNVTFLNHASAVWKKLWLLRAMYQFDCPQGGYAKMFESARVSTGTSIALPKGP